MKLTLYFFAHITLILAVLFNMGIFKKEDGWEIDLRKIKEIKIKWWGIVGGVLFLISLVLFLFSISHLEKDYYKPEKSKQEVVESDKQDKLKNEEKKYEVSFLKNSLVIGYIIHLFSFLLTFVLDFHKNSKSSSSGQNANVNIIYIIILSIICLLFPIFASIGSGDTFNQYINLIFQVITGITVIITAVSETKTKSNVPNTLGVILILMIIASVLFSSIIKISDDTSDDRDQKNIEEGITNTQSSVNSTRKEIEKDIDSVGKNINSMQVEGIKKIDSLKKIQSKNNAEIENKINDSRRELAKLENNVKGDNEKIFKAIGINFKTIENLIDINKQNTKKISENIKVLLTNIARQTQIITKQIKSLGQKNTKLKNEITEKLEKENQKLKEEINRILKNNNNNIVNELKGENQKIIEGLLQRLQQLEFSTDSLKTVYKLKVK